MGFGHDGPECRRAGYDQGALERRARSRPRPVCWCARRCGGRFGAACLSAATTPRVRSHRGGRRSHHVAATRDADWPPRCLGVGRSVVPKVGIVEGCFSGRTSQRLRTFDLVHVRGINASRRNR
ncbi:hypothetical protein ACJ5H2_22265 (plasmid) [Nocardioides sp. R1-1]|uniref:hypothetical protein n=1 Tax=Nocardioides sp. R1-1 TaxID=3383502 RepID=UPI0038CFE2A1